MIRPPAQGA